LSGFIVRRWKAFCYN